MRSSLGLDSCPLLFGGGRWCGFFTFQSCERRLILGLWAESLDVQPLSRVGPRPTLAALRAARSWVGPPFLCIT